MSTPTTTSAVPVDEKRAVVAAHPGTTARQEFGAQEMQRSGETAAAVLAAQAQALVQARYIVAMQRPRDWDDVRMRVMKEVERPGFAEVAWYRKPIGAGVEGLSVRFAEAAARCMTNLISEAVVVYEDGARRVVRVTVTDLEANLTVYKDATVERTVERKKLDDGRIAISTRKNSRGEITYTVPATEDELLGKEAAIVSKVRRNLVLQILPGDIADAAKARILEIRRGAVAKDPDGARRKILDAFALLNVPPSDIKRYLGHEPATASPAEIEELRDVYSSIHDGQTTWSEALAEKVSSRGEAGKPEEKPKDLDGLADSLTPPATPAPAADPPVRCKKHPDVDLSKDDTCWKCVEEVKDLAEAGARPAVKEPAPGKPRQGRLQE